MRSSLFGGKAAWLACATVLLLAPVAATAGIVTLDSRFWSVNGKAYYLLADNIGGVASGVTWAAAEAYAVSTLGGHLATVDSAELNAWLWLAFVPYPALADWPTDCEMSIGSDSPILIPLVPWARDIQLDASSAIPSSMRPTCSPGSGCACSSHRKSCPPAAIARKNRSFCCSEKATVLPVGLGVSDG